MTATSQSQLMNKEQNIPMPDLGECFDLGVLKDKAMQTSECRTKAIAVDDIIINSMVSLSMKFFSISSLGLITSVLIYLKFQSLSNSFSALLTVPFIIGFSSMLLTILLEKITRNKKIRFIRF